MIWTWDFDVFKVAEIVGEESSIYLIINIYLFIDPLTAVGTLLFQLIDSKSLLMFEAVQKYLNLAWSKYHSTNPYHNGLHGTDVAQAMFYFIQYPLFKKCLDYYDQVSCIFAACVHDLGHTGESNGFLINSNAELAIRYNDKSPLENMHCAEAFSLLKVLLLLLLFVVRILIVIYFLPLNLIKSYS